MEKLTIKSVGTLFIEDHFTDEEYTSLLVLTKSGDVYRHFTNFTYATKQAMAKLKHNVLTQGSITNNPALWELVKLDELMDARGYTSYEYSLTQK